MYAMNARRMSGALLIVSFALMMAGVLMYASRRGQNVPHTARRYVIERSLLMASMALVVPGYALISDLLAGSPGEILARVAASSIVVGTALGMTVEATWISKGENLYALLVAYVMIAFLSQAALGGALAASGMQRTIGWVMLGWNLVWPAVLVALTPRDVYFPVLHHFLFIALGLALLLGS